MGLFDFFKKNNDDNDGIKDFDNEFLEEDESLSVYDAAEIWKSYGEDKDYTFGYTQEELENALDKMDV